MLPRGGVPREVFSWCALVIVSVGAAAQSRESSSPFADLLPELAARIAAAIAPANQVRLAGRAANPAGRAQGEAVDRELRRALDIRRVNVVDNGDTIPLVTYTCAESLRGRMCAADVQVAGVRYSLVAERWRSGSTAAGVPTPVLSLQPLFAQELPLLDVVVTGSRLLVLDPSTVSLYERSGAWKLVMSAPIRTARRWPRDLRGRLRVNGAEVEAFLPGTTCRGSVDPLSLTCADTQRPWPIGIENVGIEAGRNAFSRQDGSTFFSGVELGPESGARFLLVTGSTMSFVDERGAISLVIGDALQDSDAVVGLTTDCAAGPHVLLSSQEATSADDLLHPPADPRDALRLYRITSLEFMPVTPRTVLPGIVTALWPTTDPTRALVISRNQWSGVYEAFHASVVCAR